MDTRISRFRLTDLFGSAEREDSVCIHAAAKSDVLPKTLLEGRELGHTPAGGLYGIQDIDTNLHEVIDQWCNITAGVKEHLGLGLGPGLALLSADLRMHQAWN